METYGSFKLFFTLCQIFGLLPFGLRISDGRYEFFESRFWLTYTKILFSFFFILQLMLLYCFWNWSSEPTMSLASKTVMSISIFSLFTILPTILVTILTKKKDLLFWLNRICDMTADFSSMNYGNLNRFNIKLLATTITFFSTATFIETKFVPHAEKKRTMPEHIEGDYEILVLVYLLILYEAKMFLHYFISFVYLLGEVCRITNRDLRENERQGKKYWIHRLRELRLKDSYKKDFVDFLHSYYIPVVSLELLWGLAASIFNMAVNTYESPLVLIIRFGYVVMDVMTVSFVCYQTEQEARKTLVVLQELFITCDDVELKEELEILSLQMQHKKVEFNALGFCKLDFTLVTSIVGTITSYIVILVQFQNDSKKERGEFKKQIMNCTVSNYTLTTGW